MGPVAVLEASGFGLGRHVPVKDQPIGGVLDEQATSCERRGRDLLAFVMQPDRPAEDVAQVERPDPLGAGVGLAGERQAARLKAVADLVRGGVSIWGAQRSVTQPPRSASITSPPRLGAITR